MEHKGEENAKKHFGYVMWFFYFVTVDCGFFHQNMHLFMFMVCFAALSIGTSSLRWQWKGIWIHS